MHLEEDALSAGQPPAKDPAIFCPTETLQLSDPLDDDLPLLVHLGPAEGRNHHHPGEVALLLVACQVPPYQVHHLLDGGGAGLPGLQGHAPEEGSLAQGPQPV